jgi:peptide/nickel transport system permease protein
MIVIGARFRELGSTGFGLIYGLLAGLGGAAIVMKSHALRVMNKPFIEAARVAGSGSRHIILRHLVPHMLPMAALYMMLTVTGAVVADGFIAFFGLTRVYMNWGAMIYQAFTYSNALGSGTQWHMLIPPSVALSLFAAAFYLIARGLHEITNPQLRKGASAMPEARP